MRQIALGPVDQNLRQTAVGLLGFTLLLVIKIKISKLVFIGAYKSSVPDTHAFVPTRLLKCSKLDTV